MLTERQQAATKSQWFDFVTMKEPAVPNVLKKPNADFICSSSDVELEL